MQYARELPIDCMKKLIKKEFFERNALVVARELLGKQLVRRLGTREVSVMITEVEAYFGFKDQASHAYRGPTLRNSPMWGPAGHIYVYFTYGMHWMLNFTVGKAGYPAAILIRGVEGAAGPARLTKLLKIDKRLNGLPLGKKAGLWLEDRGVVVPKSEIKRGPRVGVDYAGPYKLKPWRFTLRSTRTSTSFDLGATRRLVFRPGRAVGRARR